jgi:hypothetical protein
MKCYSIIRLCLGRFFAHQFPKRTCICIRKTISEKKTFYSGVGAYRFSLLPAICFFALTPLHSQDIQKILIPNSAYFSAISSITFDGIKILEHLNHGPDYQKKHQINILFKAIGDQFSYDLSSTSEILASTTTQSGAYNGDYFQVLSGKTLSLKKGLPDQIPALSQNIYFVLPFDFLRAAVAATPGHDAEDNFTLPFSEYGQKATWKIFQTNIKTVALGNLLGKRGLLITFPGRILSESVNFSVLFDPSQNYYPIAWECMVMGDSSKKETYLITNLGQITFDGKSTLYPKEALFRHYNGTLNASSTISINRVSINSLTPDEKNFTIDPESATEIYDVDKNITLEVPH